MHARPFGSVLVVLALGAIPSEAASSPPPAVSAQQTEIERQLARMQDEEAKIASEMDEAKPTLEMTRRRIVARGRAYYRLVRAGLLPAGGGFDAMVDYAAHVERSRRALERDLAAEAALVKRIAEIDARIAKVHADKVPLEVQREALVRARQALQEAEERRAAFTRAFETSGRPDAVAIYGADMGPSQEALGGFRMLRGRLSFPIAGRAEVQYETRGGGPGVAFMTSPFTGVRSVAAGRVAFADRQDEYGLTVILDHGDRYFTLYGSLGRLDVHVGDSVAAGARLGTAGSTDGSPAQLYFEIRRNGATLDPRPWLGL